jgi:hypothetical protein
MCVLAAIAAWDLAPAITAAWQGALSSPDQVQEVQESVYYPRCADARAAGAAPIYRGAPGYREGLDGDSDGVACEPYYGPSF